MRCIQGWPWSSTPWCLSPPSPCPCTTSLCICICDNTESLASLDTPPTHLLKAKVDSNAPYRNVKVSFWYVQPPTHSDSIPLAPCSSRRLAASTHCRNINALIQSLTVVADGANCREQRASAVPSTRAATSGSACRLACSASNIYVSISI